MDSEPLHHESAVAVLATHGKMVPVQTIQEFIGWSELPFWSELKKRFSLRPSTQELADERTEVYGELLHTRSLVPLPGAVEILETLRDRSIPCAIASASPRLQLKGSLESAGISKYFQALVSGHEDVKRGKPRPDVFLEAARRLGVSPSSCLAIEDSLNGTASAVASGAFTIRIPTPGDLRPQPSQEQLRLTSLKEVCALLP
ncbi:MAG: HAD family phosphatase [Planctomycetota bacterium]|nr:HAD family phosphatase [Planctomycetota bacterium]